MVSAAVPTISSLKVRTSSALLQVMVSPSLVIRGAYTSTEPPVMVRVLPSWVADATVMLQ